MYYLINEWTSDDERLRDDLEQIGIPIQPLQIENILDFIFSNRKVNSPLHMTGLSLPPVFGKCMRMGILFLME